MSRCVEQKSKHNAIIYKQTVFNDNGFYKELTSLTSLYDFSALQ